MLVYLLLFISLFKAQGTKFLRIEILNMPGMVTVQTRKSGMCLLGK